MQQKIKVMNEASIFKRLATLGSNFLAFRAGIRSLNHGVKCRNVAGLVGHPRPNNLRFSSRLFHSKGTSTSSSLRKTSFLLFLGGGGTTAFYLYKQYNSSSCHSLYFLNTNSTACCKESFETEDQTEEMEVVNYGMENVLEERRKDIQVKLYQYQTCPFCCKVRAFLDYYGIEYEKVEVNPLLRKEIKFSGYRKVPIAMVGDVQLNDSSLIISILRSYMLGKGSLNDLLVYYPKIDIEGGKKKKIEYANRHNVMYMEAMPTKAEQEAVREEAKWRRWVDQTFVHTLSPNIYRTLAESFQAFEYFSKVGNFSSFERFMAKNCGAIFMFVISKNLKKRYNLKDNVRQSFYDEATKWIKAVGKKRKFMGGNKPNLADLSVYGVLSGIEGLDAFDDLMKNTDIRPWYERVKKAVKSHQGQQEYQELIQNLSTN